MEQLIKQACDLYDWVALLWAAFGEFLARNGSPPSIIGGHSFYFRLQDPVLDKSDVKYIVTNLSPMTEARVKDRAFDRWLERYRRRLEESAKGAVRQ